MVRAFLSYSHADRGFRDELLAHLSSLMNREPKALEVWSDREIEGGSLWETEIWDHFERADLVILLVSSSFVASQFCMREEFHRAEQRQEEGKTRIVPVLVSAVDFEDGRIDKHQVLMAEKAVESWANRNEAWTAVVKELRKVLVTLERRWTVSPIEQEDGPGDAVVALVDRWIQEGAVFESFVAPLKGPQFFFLPGDSDAVHTSFVDRVRFATLPILLNQPKESLRDVTEPVVAPWVPANVRVLTAQLAARMAPGAGGGAADFRVIPKFAGKIVLVQHKLYESRWTGQTRGLIESYIAYWAGAADAAGARPWFVIFLNVEFDKKEREAEILEEMAEIAASSGQGGCGVTLLPSLPLLERSDVDEWIETNMRQYRLEATEVLERLFPTRDTKVPMSVVEKELADFVAKI